MADASSLLPVVQRFFEKDLATAARTLETMPEEQVVEVLKSLPPAIAARAVWQLQVSYAAAVLRDAESDLFNEIAQGLEPHHAGSILMHLPRDTRERFLEAIPERLRRAIQEQLAYPEESVGRLMSSRFLAFRTDTTVHEAIQHIRHMAPQRYPASYAYVVDDQDRLKGVLNMRDLLIAAPDTRLSTIMRSDVFALPSFTDREEAAAELARRRYFAAPVVDSEGRILGIVKVEQLMHGVQEEVTEDLQKMVGAGGDERVFSPVAYSLRTRLPWLHVNLACALVAASVVAMFEGLIARFTVLAVFLPIVASQGGNAGAQSLAIVMRGLVMREIPRSRVRQLILKQGALGAITGAITGLVTAGVAWLWYRNPWLGLVIGLAMFCNLIVAGVAGASIPIVMKAFGLDPAQCSSIILTAITDVIGFFAFLGFALLFQHRLI